MAAFDMRLLLLVGACVVAPVWALAQSASEVERCFHNPAACRSGPEPPVQVPSPQSTASRATPAPDYTTVLGSPEAERRKIQESLRALDKYDGPIDGNLHSDASTKAIADWQKGHGYTAVGKLTPSEAQTLNAEAAKLPIRRIEPSTKTAAAPAPAPGLSNADRLKSLQARLAERRQAAEPKANAAAEALVKDLKAYVAADGKGVAGEQFAAFAKWYADNKAAGRTIGEITAAIDDYGDGRAGPVETAEVRFGTKQDGKSFDQCLVFAWSDASPRKSTEAFSCDDVAGVEKWKTGQSLRSAWR
jgi:hypothetical protein